MSGGFFTNLQYALGATAYTAWEAKVVSYLDGVSRIAFTGEKEILNTFQLGEAIKYESVTFLQHLYDMEAFKYCSILTIDTIDDWIVHPKRAKTIGKWLWKQFIVCSEDIFMWAISHNYHDLILYALKKKWHYNEYERQISYFCWCDHKDTLTLLYNMNVFSNVTAVDIFESGNDITSVQARWMILHQHTQEFANLDEALNERTCHMYCQLEHFARVDYQLFKMCLAIRSEKIDCFQFDSDEAKYAVSISGLCSCGVNHRNKRMKLL